MKEKFNLYHTLEPYQIFLILIYDWKNFMVFYGTLSIIVIANKIVDRSDLLVIKLFGYFVIIVCAEMSHVVIYDYENPKNLLPIGVTVTVMLMLIESKSFLNKFGNKANVDLSTFTNALDDIDKKIKNKIHEIDKQ